MDHKSLLSVMRLHGRCYNYHSLFHFLNDIMSLFYRTFLRVSLKTLTRFLEDFISSALPILYVFSCSLHLENDLGAFLFCLLAFLLAGFLYLLLALNISLSSCKKKKKSYRNSECGAFSEIPRAHPAPDHLVFPLRASLPLSPPGCPASQELTAARTCVVSFTHFSYKHGFHPLISSVDSKSLLALTSLLPHSFLAGI